MTAKKRSLFLVTDVKVNQKGSIRRPEADEKGGSGPPDWFTYCDPNLGARLDDHARNGWSHHRRPRWSPVHANPDDGKHGRSQTW